MTAIIVTVTPSTAWLSTDTLVSAMPTGTMPQLVVAGASDPETPATLPSCHPVPMGFMQKVMMPPGERWAMCCVGSIHLARCAAHFLATGSYPGFDHATSAAPRTLREYLGLVPLEHRQLGVMIVGWSDREERVLGCFLNAAEDFVPARIDAGHSMTPPPRPEIAGYEALATAWPRALDGYGVAGFHRLVAINQVRAMRAGLHLATGGIGGDLWTAKIDRNGVELECSGPIERKEAA